MDLLTRDAGITVKPANDAADSVSDALRQQAHEWFARLRADEDSEASWSAFEDWLDADPRHLHAYRLIAADSAAPSFVLAQPSDDSQASPAPPKRRRSRWMIAASLLLAAGLLGAGRVPSLMADQRTAVGERRALMLADGSELTLDSESAVNITDTAEQRTVQLLSGRVFLRVQPDPLRPLLVRAGHTTVRVIGTRFSVAREQDTVLVAVQQGRVCVNPREQRPAQILTRGEGLRIDAAGFQRYELADSSGFAWMHGQMAVNDRPLAEALSELDRYFPGRIMLFNEQAAAMHISGSFSLDDPRAAAAQLAHDAGARAISLGTVLLLIL